MAREYWKPGNMLYPLPAVMVSCQRPGEKPNIVTVAWAGTVCSDPAMLSISVRPSRYSHDIIEETGEFVVNLIDEKTTRAMDFCGVKSGRDIDKFKECHLTAIPSKTVSAPSIEECPVSIECRVKQILRLGSHDMFVAEVTAVSVEDKYMDAKGKFHLNDLGLTAYSHGEYFTLGKKLGKFGYSVEGTGRKR
ncbi:MAG: flavin reductase family protein [Lachnospiraceae bacterium]|nr:flavin reductase family protein [Lachnospiraceae bacterium]